MGPGGLRNRLELVVGHRLVVAIVGLVAVAVGRCAEAAVAGAVVAAGRTAASGVLAFAVEVTRTAVTALFGEARHGHGEAGRNCAAHIVWRVPRCASCTACQ